MDFGQCTRHGGACPARQHETEALASSLESSDGVYFVPAFVGLGAPYWRSDARAALFGLTRGSGRAHLVRAVLESLAYQTRDVLAAMQADSGISLKSLRVDGGAVANNFLLQFQSDILGVNVERPDIAETTALGAAYLAGLAIGFWTDRGEIAQHWVVGRTFTPQMAPTTSAQLYRGWQRAAASQQSADRLLRLRLTLHVDPPCSTLALMEPSTSKTQISFDKLLRAYQTGGVCYEDLLAQLDRYLLAGAVRTDLLDTLRRRESVEPLADAVYLAIWSRLRRAPITSLNLTPETNDRLNA